MNRELQAIFEHLETEKGIKKKVIIDAILESLQAAIRKSVSGLGENCFPEFNSETYEFEVYRIRKVVEKVEKPLEEISLEDARLHNPDFNIGDTVELQVPAKDFGRIAAQTARQVIAQKLKGAERDVIMADYNNRKEKIISGTVKRFIRGRTMIVDIGKVEAKIPDTHYPKTERYNVGDKVTALLLEVASTENGGAEVILSRTHPDFVVALYEQEVHELKDDIVEIVEIARDAGYRTKIAVRSNDPKVDPVGACVGSKGVRIRSIITELNNEKIDVVPWSADPITFLDNLLGRSAVPNAKSMIRKIKSCDDEKVSIVVCDEDFAIAVGKKGMNARLIGRMLGRELEIQKLSEYQALLSIQMSELAALEDPSLDEPIKIEDVPGLKIESLIQGGFDTLRKFMEADPDEFPTLVPGVNFYEIAEKVVDQRRKEKA